MTYERALRGLTLITTAIAFPLLIVTTIVSLDIERERHYQYWYQPRDVTAFCFGYIPLAATVGISAASILYHRKHGRMPGSKFTFVDLFAFVSYIAILLPIWIVEIGRLRQPGWGLLAGYLTAPMIVNMFIHAFFVIYNIQSLWARFASKGVHECPNCHSSFTVGQPEAPRPTQQKEGYSLLRGEVYLDDEEEVPYAGVRSSDEAEAAPKEQGKGKAILDV